MVVDFYRTVGYLPHAVLNYLLLLGWSLDDKTEQFTPDGMIEQFSLERVNKSPASFDPMKLWAFQQREMLELPIEQKVGMCRSYVSAAGFVDDPPPEWLDDRLAQIVTAAGDRIKVAGDILDYPEFFVADDQLAYDEKAVGKRLQKEGAGPRLQRFRDRLAGLESFDAASTEAELRDFLDAEGVKIGDVIHALRVATTGKAVGLGMFDCLAILGQDRVLARIDRALGML